LEGKGRLAANQMGVVWAERRTKDREMTQLDLYFRTVKNLL
jgi:hypothetical protein